MFFGPGQLVMFRKFCRDIKWWHLKRNICQSPFLNSTISMLIPYKIFQCICWLVIWILIPAASMTKIDPSLTETFACHHTFILCQSDSWLYYCRRGPLLGSMIINMFMVTDFPDLPGMTFVSGSWAGLGCWKIMSDLEI